jgi:hypothetical protein
MKEIGLEAARDHFVSKTCKGEICGMCWREGRHHIEATHKLGEELPADYPHHRHNATQYVCCKHFSAVVGLMTAIDWSIMKRDWALLSVVDGKDTDRVIRIETETEARNWVERFPRSYRLLSRASAGEWERDES